MTKSEVSRYVGAPKKRSYEGDVANGTNEIWNYDKHQVQFRDNKVILVTGDQAVHAK